MNISPAFRYEDAPAAIDWLVRAFGFEKKSIVEAPDGGIAHAELRLGTGVIALNSAHRIAGNPWSEVRQGVYVCLADVDRHHDRAKAAGADIASPLKDLEYGSREYAVRDCGGHLWSFGTYAMAKPGDEPNMFVGLHYEDSRAAVAWLSKTFGFVSAFEVAAPGGSLAHAEMRLAEDTLMIDSGPRDPRIWGEDAQALYVYVADPDAHYAQATMAGATIVRPLEQTPWGSRGYYARDPGGFLWGFSTYRPQA
ncbi:MAG TPA: VOC family protein [Vicinamibacterales bacterium]|jgi:uncharacterized glyoxalase superfamily protein PhnB